MYVGAVAISCTAASGSQRIPSVGLSWLAATQLGVGTAIVGRVVPDAPLRDMSHILGGHRLYATSALAASGVLGLRHESGAPVVGVTTETVTGGALCLISYHRRWTLPTRQP